METEKKLSNVDLGQTPSFAKSVETDVDGAATNDEVLAPQRKRKLALASACILGNEFCERLAYYGIQTNMGLYLKKYMGYGSEEATQLLQVWKATVYLTPLLGAILADAYMGRFLVILVFSSIYFLGMLGLTIVNLVPKIKPEYLTAPKGGYETTRGVFWAMMYLIALGSGGIKPCVSSFGGDQFREESPRERGWRSRFFNFFYFAVNVGSLIATLVVVPVQESSGYALGFGIPTILFGVAIIAFVIGSVLYTKVPPAGSPFMRMWWVLSGAFRNRSQALTNDPRQLYDPLDAKDTRVAFRMLHTDGMRCLDKAALPSTDTSSKRHQCTVTEVEETKAFIRILPIFLCVCIWQMGYDPIFTFLPFPGDAMDRTMGSFQIPASSISFANTFGVLFTVLLYDLIIVPVTNKLKRPISMTLRIGIGFFLLALSLVSAALVEMARLRVINDSGIVSAYLANPLPDCDASGGTPGDGTCKYYTDPEYAEPISIWWQFIPYFLIGAAEVFTNIGTMELFYTQVSEGMRALGTSFYLLTVCIGTYMATALNLIIAAITNNTWVASNPLLAHYDYYFWANVVIVMLGMAIFFLVARHYKEKPIIDSDNDPLNQESRVHAELANVARSWPSVSHASRMSDLQERSSIVVKRSAVLPVSHLAMVETSSASTPMFK